MQEIDLIIQWCNRELTFDYIRAAGPGGQNVNKVATAVQLRFNVCGSPSLHKNVKEKLTHLAGTRMTIEGVLIIDARRYRTQEKNREDALARFSALIRKSLAKPKIRRKTMPNTASREKRLESKKKRGEVKRTRQNRTFD